MRNLHRARLTEEVTLQIMNYIRDHGLVPGDRLPPENSFAKMLGVGRGTVRESLTHLVALQRVVSRQGQGYFLQSSDRDLILSPQMVSAMLMGATLNEIYECRMLVESEAATLVAQRATLEDLETLDQQIAALSKAVHDGESRERIYDLAMGVHDVIAAAAHNTILLRLVRLLARLAKEAHQMFYTPNVTAAEELAGHRALIEAVKSGDPLRAKNEMLLHLKAAAAITRGAMDRAGFQGPIPDATENRS